MESIRYVALGDSYTIGTGLEDESQNFPSLLAKRITVDTGIDVPLVNLGVNGYTTTDLIREELPVARDLLPGLVTILIGANDVVQRSTEAAYRKRLAEIYDALARLPLPPAMVVSVSTPDFSALPGGAPFGTPTDLRTRIDAFNRIAQSEAAARRFHYADISAITREVNRGRDWLAADGLHPGPAQHRAIADQLWRLLGPAIRLRAMAEGGSDRVHGEYVVLDIGKGVGALLIYTKPELRGTEIEVSRVGDDARRIHAEVLERPGAGQPVFAAVLAALPEGDYRIWTEDLGLRNVVTIRGGEVAEVDWR